MAVAGAPARVGVHVGPTRRQAPRLVRDWAQCGAEWPTFPRGRELKTERGSWWHF